MLRFIAFISQIRNSLSSQENDINTETPLDSNVCQSGLREDNTNYIYCARQNLKKIPNFFANSNSAHSSSSNSIIKNVIYDELVLSDNLIDLIEKNSFTNNLKVKKLYLDQNPILHIDENAFDYVRNYLEEVYFDKKAAITSAQNTEKKFYDYFFEDEIETSETPKQKVTDDLEIFEKSVLRKCFNLRLLSIKSYQIAELNEYLFIKLNKIEKLELVHLNLRKIDRKAFVGLESSLVELNLDSNWLELVPSLAIEGLKRLKKLTLSQNRIKTLQSNAFFKVSSSLNTLDLSYNYLSYVDDSAFNGPIQNNLKILQIQNNELKWSHFVQLLFNLHQLQELNIDFNKLSVRSDTMKNQEEIENYSNVHLNLVSLSMQGNGLTDISWFTDFYDYDYLLTTLPNNYLASQQNRKKFKYEKLSKLNLARNKIKSIPDVFFSNLNMSQLKILVFDRNTFDTSLFSSKSFVGLERSLETMSLNNVGFVLWSSNLLDSLNVLENLKILKLNGNGVGKNVAVPEKSLSLKRLTSIELQNNNLVEMPNFFCELENLVDLDLSTNRIKKLNSNCQLFKLNPKQTKLKHLNLNNNPLECDCELRELKMWLMNNYEKDLLDLIKWQCSKPFHLSGKQLTSVNLADLLCEKVEDLIKIDSSIVLVQNDELKSTQELSTTFSMVTKMITTQPTTTVNPIIDQLDIINEERAIKSTQIYSLNDDSKNILNWLVMAVGLGILIVMLLILIALYLFCARNRSELAKTSYVNDFLNKIDDKYENRRFFSESPLFSLSNSSASSTTTSVGSVYTNKSSAADLVDIFGSEYFNSMLNLVNINDMAKSKKKLHSREEQLEMQTANNCSKNSIHYYDKPINSIFNRNFVLNNSAIAALQSRFFLVETENGDNQSHIYHEINNVPTKNYATELKHDGGHFQNDFIAKNKKLNCINNDNYLLQPNLESHYNSLCFYNGANNNNNNLFSNAIKLNSFNDGLIV